MHPLCIRCLLMGAASFPFFHCLDVKDCSKSTIAVNSSLSAALVWHIGQETAVLQATSPPHAGLCEAHGPCVRASLSQDLRLWDPTRLNLLVLNSRAFSMVFGPLWQILTEAGRCYWPSDRAARKTEKVLCRLLSLAKLF